jgi:large subunit ribosomal protein L18
MSIVKKKHASRIKRKKRVRQSVQGTDAKPRLCVYKSLKYTYAQLISDDSGKVLLSATSRSLDMSATDDASRQVGRGSVEAAKLLGVEIAKLAKEKNLGKVVFDRNGYVYHGRVAAVAEGAREGGLDF